MSGEPSTKRSGGDSHEEPASLDDLIDEASAESFPCSDPPAYTSLHVGPPTPMNVELERTRPAAETHAEERLRRLVRLEGIFFVVSGLWPMVHPRSFEALTGRSLDARRMRTIGALVASAGLALLAISRPIQFAQSWRARRGRDAEARQRRASRA